MGKVITFDSPHEVQSLRDAIEFSYPFLLVESDLVGKPEELSQSTKHELKVGVSGSLAACWNLPRHLLERVLFEYGNRYLRQKLRDGALSDTEELFLHTGNSENTCPYDPHRIGVVQGARIEIEDAKEKLMENLSFLQLASRIIDTRDNINALFHEKHGEKLIVAREERDLLQFFRDATTIEEFFFRICALANAATGLNITILRNITGTSDTKIKSVGLLERYISNNNYDNSVTPNTLRAINKLRQAYPVHGDRTDGVMKAHKYFGLAYPIADYSSAWSTVLTAYLDALERFLDNLKGNS